MSLHPHPPQHRAPQLGHLLASCLRGPLSCHRNSIRPKTSRKVRNFDWCCPTLTDTSPGAAGEGKGDQVPETPADEAGSSATGMDEEGDAPEWAGPQSSKPKKKKMSGKKKGKKNSPRPPSWAAVNNVGELVEKVDSGGEDPPVIGETPHAKAEKTAEASGK
ncbi:hypothetical protein BJV74DRAFT_42685 [Russula compacta]|nr:hypothetical protein BJV74DRAFT_42685 [Russula compacta]